MLKLNVVPARTGLVWFRLGVKNFFRQPLALSGLFFMYMAAVVLLALIPVVGLVASSMLVPAATLGLMAAAAETERGKFPMPTVLLSAFRAGRERMRAMLMLGAIYTVGTLVAMAIGAWIAGPEAAAPAAGATPPAPEIDLRMLVTFLVFSPLFLLFWHAPALVHFHGVSPMKSLFFSAVACLRNIGAFFVFGLLWATAFMGASLLVAMIGGLFGGVGAAQAALFPLAMLLGAMFSASLWFTFRDSFSASDVTNGSTMSGPGAEGGP